ncbi:stage III sporulation protein SpoIIIAB [Anaerosalibacter sp. Marseille-P3206]|uniref:stage III sporulation protein SpoIIIAB n=1 Tax=Anaerosalibacter sp. Marseille-P3206 TaxID=1871005 RepID=UPI00098475D8|nr:stage III sporulation protein SpoIIIAB [Anaerosalibacter sp. Marseille-P3206]
MTTLKIFGSLLIILSSSLMGYMYGIRYRDRVNNLVLLENCIKLLETEIIYAANPLPEALMNVYRKGNQKVSYVFERIADELVVNKSGTVYECFESVVNISRDELCFKDEDIELFLTLGRTIGTSDRFDQEKNFKLILTQIKTLEVEAQLSKEKNEKLYKSLGILSGLAIVIILL